MTRITSDTAIADQDLLTETTATWVEIEEVVVNIKDEDEAPAVDHGINRGPDDTNSKHCNHDKR